MLSTSKNVLFPADSFVTFIHFFIGDIADAVATESYIFEVTTSEENTWSTGMYLLPGQEMTVEVLSDNNIQYQEFEVKYAFPIVNSGILI